MMNALEFMSASSIISYNTLLNVVAVVAVYLSRSRSFTLFAFFEAKDHLQKNCIQLLKIVYINTQYLYTLKDKFINGSLG